MPIVARTCSMCSAEFMFSATPYAVRIGGGKFCSHSCRAKCYAWQRLSTYKDETPCQQCSAPVKRTTKNKGQRFCSRRCHDIARTTTRDRFWSFVQRGEQNECWPWLGAKSKSGYGVLSAGPRGQVRAHRFAYELTHGAIPDGLVVCHACDNRPCCNPAHLWIGTTQDNEDDKRAKGRNIRGALSPRAKLTDEIVLSIRSSNDSVTQLAVRYGVSCGTISAVRRGITWKHVASHGTAGGNVWALR
jgi:hypothetical protein